MKRVFLLMLVVLMISLCVIAQAGLVAHYDFHEGSGTTLTDVSGNGNNAAIVGATWTGGKLNFDGNNDYLNPGTTGGLGITDNMSFAAWVHFKSLTPGVDTNYHLFSNLNWNTSGQTLRIEGTSFNLKYICCDQPWLPGNPSGYYQKTVTNIYLSNDTTYHIGFIRNGGNIKIFVNGVLRANENLMLAKSNALPIYISNNSQAFAGQMLDVKFYNSPLTDWEMEMLADQLPILLENIDVEPVPTQHKILIEASKRDIGPAGENALGCFELYRADIPNGPIVASVMMVPFDSDGKVSTSMNVSGITAGPYKIKAYAVNPPNDELIGEPVYVNVQWPVVEEFPNGPVGARRLNNLVTELLNVPNGVSNFAYSFYNQRNGWIYIANSGSASVTLTSQSGSRVIQLSTEYNGANEAMLELPMGNYAVSANSPDKLIVRAIPEIVYSTYGLYPQTPPIASGGDLERQYIFKQINTITTYELGNDPFAGEWTSMGRKWLMQCSLPREINGQPITVSQAANFIASTPGFNDANSAGSIGDEFGSSEPICSIYADAILQLKQNPVYADRVFYAWGNNIVDGHDGIDFMNALTETGGKLALKNYFPEQTTEIDAWRYINSILTDRIKQYRLNCAGSPQNIVVCYGNFSAPGETLDTLPGINYLVYLDMQFQISAAHPDLADVGGIMSYLSSYSDEEVIRWCGMLFRHYGIDGNTQPLADYPYILNNLQNGDFDKQGTNWTISPAQTNSITFSNSPGFGWLEGRYPHSAGLGDNVIVLERSTVAPNSFSQTINNLEPGKRYSFEMISGDYVDMSVEQNHAVSVDISNVTPDPDHNFQYVFHNNYSHEYPPYNANNLAWMNYYWKVFKANSTTATLTVSDWLNGSTPGGAIGQKLMFNFIQVEPYLPNMPPSINISAPSAPSTMGSPITYTITYDGAEIITLSTSDVTLNKTGTADGTVAVTGTGNLTRTVTISDFTGDGTLGISIVAGTASDAAGNIASETGPSATFILDGPPTISISAPSASVTKGGPITYTITYGVTSSVTLAAAHITLNKTGTAKGFKAVSGFGTTTRIVTVSGITGDGTIGISIAAGTASDSFGRTAPAAGPSTAFTVDNTPPSISIGVPSAPSTQNGPINYTITYGGADNITLAAGNITLNKTGTANGTIAVTGSGTTTRTVTISGITGNGTLGISIAAGTASDAAGNNTAAAGPSTTFTVDNTPPTFTLNGTVNLLNFSGNKSTVTGTVELDGTSYPLILDTDGKFTILNVAAGTYDVRIKASHWLAKLTPGVGVSSNTIMGTVDVINGDVVDNNEVDFDDINTVRAAYGSFPGDGNWNERADVDGTGEVDFTDINIVRSKYGEIGD